MEAMVRSIPIYYEEYGTGIPLLMLHGWPSDHHLMAFLFEPLFKNRTGWRRIYLDLPGMGKTPGAEWITTQDDMLKVVTEFMEAVAPNQRFVVAGNSYGGHLARGLVYQRGTLIDGLCLDVPLVEPYLPKQNLPIHQVLVEDPQYLAALTTEEEENNLRNLFVVQSLEALELLRTIGKRAFEAADYTFLGRLWNHFAYSFPVDKLATPFPAPTLILTGRQDATLGYQEAWSILDNYPRATFVVLDRAGHLLAIEQRGLFHSLADEWLNRVEEYIAQGSSSD